MEIIQSKSMDDAILKLMALYMLDIVELEYIGNPIDLYGIQGFTDQDVQVMIDRTKASFFYGEIPEKLEKNIIPASLFASIFAPEFLSHCLSKEDGFFMCKNIMRESIYLSTDEMENDPYVKNIKFPKIKTGNYMFDYGVLTKYDLFVLDNIYADTPFDRLQIPVVACMDRDYVYPILEEKGNVWMSIAPNEIVTMRDDISAAEGNVLTYGLGLGYYPYIVSRKENVSHVTVVEKNKTIVDLFEKYLLPQMETKDKITVIHEDAFEHIKKVSDGEYDTCFSDIWVSSDDVDTYLKLKSACSKFSKTKASFWIEQRFIGMLLMILSQRLFYEYYGFSMLNTDYLKNCYPYANKVLNKMTKNKVFSDPNELMEYFTPKNIQKCLI